MLQKDHVLCSIPVPIIQLELIQIWSNGNRLRKSVKQEVCIHFSILPIKVLLPVTLVKMEKH